MNQFLLKIRAVKKYQINFIKKIKNIVDLICVFYLVINDQSYLNNLCLKMTAYNF
jgi:hypothetical protein